MRNPSPGSCRGGCGRAGEATVPIGAALTTRSRRTPALCMARVRAWVPAPGHPGVGLRAGPRERTAPRRRRRPRSAVLREAVRPDRGAARSAAMTRIGAGGSLLGVRATAVTSWPAQGLVDQLPPEAAGGGDDGELHGMPPVPRLVVIGMTDRASRGNGASGPASPGTVTSRARTWPLPWCHHVGFGHAAPLGGGDEQRGPGPAAQHAGEGPAVQFDGLLDGAALGHPHAALVRYVGVPDGVLLVGADAVGSSVAQVGPGPLVRQIAIRADVKGQQAVGVGVRDDQGGVVGGDGHPVGEVDAGGAPGGPGRPARRGTRSRAGTPPRRSA